MILTILDHHVKVKRCDAKGWETGSHGQYTDNDNLIRVKKDLSPEAENLTILHEATHLADSLISITLTEAQTQQIALFIYSLIKNNPEFVQRIWEDE